MIDFLRTWIANIGAVMIFIIVMDIIMPNGDMKRFTKVIAGLIIIIVIVKPFLIIKDINPDFQLSIIQASTYIDGNISKEGEVINKYQSTKAMEIFKENIRTEIRNKINQNQSIDKKDIHIELDIDDNPVSKEFGNIIGLNIIINENKNTAIQVSKIDEININDNKQVINQKIDEYNVNNSKLRKEIKQSVEILIGIPQEIINVEILQ